MVYLLVFIVLLFFAIVYDSSLKGTKNSYESKVAIVISFIILTLLAGLRYRVGTDSLVYMDEYYKYPIPYFKDKYLLGWYWLMAICKSLNISFYFVQIILAFFTNYAVFSFLKRYSCHFFSSLLLYFVIVYPGINFELLRQGICISIFLLSFQYLEKRAFVKYFVCVGLACLFHFSALILLFLPLFTWIPINKKVLSFFLIIVFFVIVFSTIMKDRIYEFSKDLSFLDGRSFYYFKEVDVEESFSPISYIFNLTMNVFIPLLIIRFHLYSDRIPSQYVLICMFSMIIYIISMYMPIIYRFNHYFQLLNLVLFVDLFNWIRCRFKYKSYLVFLICLLLFIGVKSRSYFAKDEGCPIYYHYYPYSSIINEYKVPQREQWD